MTRVRWGVSALAAVVASAFVWAAVDRRLNFDEALALRAGVLELTGGEAEPAFVMPATLLFGALSGVVADPGALFLVLRLLVVGSVLASFGWLARSAGLSGTRQLLALVVLLLQAAFATHGVEFRYDWAVLVGLLIALAGICRSTPRSAGVAAAALVFVACHQVKGLFLALLLAAVLALSARVVPGAARAAAWGAGATGAAWLATVASLGLLDRWLETFFTFASLGQESARVSVVESLGPAMLRDVAWWTMVCVALLSALAARRTRRLGHAERLLLGVGLATLLFALVHPHAWPYMLALPAPFLALFVVGRWPESGEPSGVRRWLVVLALALAVQLLLPGSRPLAAHRAALRSPRAPEVAQLRLLRELASPGDRVLDPSGLVYFLPPCTRQWYSDSLFFERARHGEWMSELAAGVPDSCRWVVDSYRLSMLPPAAKAELERDFANVGGALFARSRAAPQLPPESVRGLPRTIENYW